MAYQGQFYSAGTVTVADGSATVTGSDTGWETALIEGGVFYVLGSAYPILSVDEETKLTLAIPFSGPGSAGLAYAIDRQRSAAVSNIAMNDRLAEIIASIHGAQPESDLLSAFAALKGADGKLPIFTSENTFGLGDYIADAKGSIAKLAALELAARQILQTDASGKLTALTLKARQMLQTDPDGALKAVDLAANKALATDANGDVAPIDLGTLGRVLLALATGTNAQYVRGDGQLATLNKAAVGLGNVDNTSDASKPISTAQQAALNGKAGFGYNVFTDNQEIRKGIPRLYFISPSATYGYRMEANISDTVNGSWRVGAGYAGPVLLECFADNRVVVPGTLSKGGGTFLIDHPLFSLYKTKNLRHGFVESTEYLNIYRGEVRLVNGRATVNIDEFFGMTVGTFWALNADITVSSLQNQESFDRLKPGAALDSGTFEIVCENENSNDLVAWMVTGRRKDPFVLHLDPNCERGTGKFIPEFDKPDYVENANG